MLGLSQVNHPAVSHSHTQPSIGEQPTNLEKAAQGTSRLMKYRKSTTETPASALKENAQINANVISTHQADTSTSVPKNHLKPTDNFPMHKSAFKNTESTYVSAMKKKSLAEEQKVVQETQIETEAAAKVKASQSDINNNYFQIRRTASGVRCVKLDQNLTPDELKKLKADGELASKEDGAIVIYGNKGSLPTHMVDADGQVCPVKRATAKQEATLNELLRQYTQYHAEYHAELHAEEPKRDKKDDRNDYAVIQNGRSNALFMPQTVATEVREKGENKADLNLNNVLTAAADLAKERKEDAIEKKREMNAAHAREIHEWQEYKDILKKHGEAPDSPNLGVRAIHTVKVSQ